MSLAIKPHEILSLLMTDLITFCLYGIRNLVMGNLRKLIAFCEKLSIGAKTIIAIALFTCLPF